jgi:hypothetical protein
MKTNTLKQIAILAISAIGLYYSGLHLRTISSIHSLLGALNIIIFSTCFFSFLILSRNLSGKFFAKLVVH